MNHGFIGFGKLAQAIYAGIKDTSEVVCAYTSKTNRYKEIPSHANISSLVEWADVIWLCIKPQQLSDVAVKIKELSLQTKVIVSPLAGKSIAAITSELEQEIPVLRIMPNLAIAYKTSVTAYCSNDPQSIVVQQIITMLANLGVVVALPEEEFSVFTAAFGSGPAFLLQVMQAHESYIDQLSISARDKRVLLQKLFQGTYAYLGQNRDVPIDQLIKNITSAGGTTAAGLRIWEDENLSLLWQQMLMAAANRSDELLA